MFRAFIQNEFYQIDLFTVMDHATAATFLL
jgi:hypothetical protein